MLACPVLCSMQLAGFEVLGWRPLLRLLFLLSLLPWPITRSQTTPGAPSALTALRSRSALSTPGILIDLTGPGTPPIPTAPGTPRTPSLRELARALMRDFPLVDGCVGAGGGNRG